jgi:hypothetical protein
MGATTHSLEVNAPVGAVYGQWTQFEEFPRFMEGVIEIQRHDTKRLLWKVNIGGKDKEWEAEILEQIPDSRIVWESVDGTENRGTIAFEPLDLDRTLITLTMEYEPEGFLERAGDALGIPSSQVEGNLKRFRDFIERREMENGTSVDQRDEGVINGDRAVVSGSGTLSPTHTEEIVAPTEAEEEIKNPEPVGHSSLLSAEEEGHSEFYRDAGVLSPTREQIAQRAYELYLARGSVHGYEREDWLEAEKQLTELPARSTAKEVS